MLIKIVRIVLMSIVISLLFGLTEVSAQCGDDGTKPCGSTKKPTTTKKTPIKPTVTRPKTPTKTPTKTVVKTSTKQTCPPPTNNNDAPSNFTQTINGVKFEMVGIPSGSFCMGSNDGEDYEKPIHKVIISRAFWLGKYEITQAQWKAVMGNNPSLFANCGGDCPVENITGEDVEDFIRMLNKKGEGTYRLPTEAEWEYAARAGSTTKYSYGDGQSSLENYAWYSANSENKTHPVGQKAANEFGLYDMYGNVFEWVADWDTDYSDGTVINPRGATSGSDRLTRGGSYYSSAIDLRSAFRQAYSPLRGFSTQGVRVVKQ